ncbi:RUN and FYVE domain-containing protein 2 isoform X1 [Lingula anatina]|uniref:RUN and FYVE domain-containing protein 2 isoform X1 n=1 Tax=Lingula anatina TaxID=7574 RepID=A0A1S3I786_LINAN|nr:RUN and FYVE domain-containing protein 2 isoform X1 [Lingula anatina]|eukprot:XP_013394068.1 RUN and FYVE domain-containing protein 2 isoform X1 [Lingula anatina]
MAAPSVEGLPLTDTSSAGGDPGVAKPIATTQKDESSYWPSPVIAFIRGKDPGANKTKPKRERRDPMAIERSNLLHVAKLVIKELIDSSLSQGRMLDDDFVPLQQFFVVLEHVLRHGLKPKKSILRDKREFFPVLEQIEKHVSEAEEITTSVRDMPNLKTPLGRARAFLRLALMQKRLADYFKVLIDKKDDVLVDFYEPGAFMLEEEGIVISGLLVGLNVIDCNICIKEDDLDEPMGVIDFSLYLKDNSFLGQNEEEDGSEGNAKMAAILDQKNYLEELNRHLNATVTNLQQKMEAVQTSNTLMREDLAISKNNILALQEENSQLRHEKEGLETSYQRKMESAQADLSVERETYITSRQGLDHLYADSKKREEEEIQMRMDLEKELELQIGMKTEMEMAMRLLEKDVHEKQDTVVSLRKQLDEIKQINLELYNKLQACDGSLKHKTELVAKLEEKTNQMQEAMRAMEARVKQCESDKIAAEETARKLGQQLAEKDSRRAALETDLRIEREWRGTVQKTLEQERGKVSQLQSDLQQMGKVKQEYSDLMKRHESMKQTCEEQEKALTELGSHLSESKLKMEDLREAQQALKEAQWADDAEATNCKGCTKEFSLSRRKHHCRNCGDIYCSECSDNKMPLPSSAKPVRVCDNCHTLLLQRYSANK